MLYLGVKLIVIKTSYHLMEEALKNIRNGVLFNSENISGFTDNYIKDGYVKE